MNEYESEIVAKWRRSVKISPKFHRKILEDKKTTNVLANFTYSNGLGKKTFSLMIMEF